MKNGNIDETLLIKPLIIRTINKIQLKKRISKFWNGVEDISYITIEHLNPYGNNIGWRSIVYSLRHIAEQ